MSTFKTTDIILASCLRLNNANMTSIELCGNKGTFVFEEVAEEFLNDFDLGNVTVEPISFNNMIKQLTTAVRRMSRG